LFAMILFVAIGKTENAEITEIAEKGNHLD
jgi:hypothetical protein